MDWKIYAAHRSAHVKKFEEETNLECHLLLDVSRSMGYGSHAVTKLRVRRRTWRRALAYLMNRQRDAVGLLTFDDHIRDLLPPSARPGHLKAVLLTLERLTLGTRTDIAKPLSDLVAGHQASGAWSC